MPVKYTEDMLKEAVKNSFSIAGVLRYLDAGSSGSVHGHIKRRIIGYGMDTSHFGSNIQKGVFISGKTADEILICLPDTATKRITRDMLMRAMLEKGVVYRCNLSDCPNPQPMWRRKTLPLEIDHIDGKWRNCLLENLRFICPNCHAQTPSNFRSMAIAADSLEEFLIESKKRRKIHRDLCSCGREKLTSSDRCRSCASATKRTDAIYPAVNILITEIKGSSYVAVGKRLGVSDNALRKYLRRNKIDPKTFESI